MTASGLKIGIDGKKLTLRFHANSPTPDYGAGWSSSSGRLPSTRGTSSPERAPSLPRQTQRTISSTPKAHIAPAPTLETFVRRIWAWLKAKRALQLRSKRLSVTETISLGDKRFVSIIKVDDQHFLVGGSTANVTLLSHLPRRPQDTESFDTILNESWANARKGA